jgi:RHS repeat-associated protein
MFSTELSREWKSRATSVEVACDKTFARVDLGAANASERVLWYLTDHLNSVRLVLDASGAILDQIAYDAFGQIVARLNPTTGVVGSLFDNPILFSSREFDAETGLYYNRARYLDPATGRWTTQDPLGFAAGDANLYRYVGNRATLATDPSGNIAWFVAVPLVMSVGGFTWLTGSTALVSYRTTGSWWDAGTWGASWDGLRLGIQANINGLATAGRSLLTLGCGMSRGKCGQSIRWIGRTTTMLSWPPASAGSCCRRRWLVG